MRITARDARRLAIAAQGLSGPRPRPTPGRVLALIQRISYLQLDPTNVVARNPYQILQSRLGTYDPSTLDGLLARRKLFETPSLILPVSDLRIHAATMHAYRRATDPRGTGDRYARGDNAGGGIYWERAQQWLTNNRHIRREILGRLRREGPLPLAAFDGEKVSWTAGQWDAERNFTMALAILQRRGEIVVASRRRGQKLYGPADGWLTGIKPPRGATLAREAAARALGVLQIATLKQLRWQYAFGRHVTQMALDALEHDGEIIRVDIEGLPSRPPFYAPADIAQRLRRVNDEWQPRTTLLSPFDNLIIDRDRTHALFGYFYRMEIYVPPAKRTLGYWAMPVLHGDRIVGSVDPRVDRERGELIVNQVVLRPDAPRGTKLAIRRAVEELAEFVGADPPGRSVPGAHPPGARRVGR